MARIAGSDSARTRAMICEKALALSAHSGFEALTMRALAGAVGVQVAAIYHYFPDKQSLLASLLNVHFERIIEAVRALPSSGTAKERLVQFARFHITDHALHRPSALLAAQEMRSLTRENASVILPKRQSYERVLRQILSEGVDDGSLEAVDINLVSAAILAMLTEVAIWFRPGGKATLDEVADTFAVAALKMAAR